MQRFLRHGGGRRGLSFERLEDRLPLAGNVTAAVSVDGDISILGDSAENAVAVFIRQQDGPAPDLLVVQGKAGTTVGGATEQTFDVPAGGFDDLTVNLGAANVAPGFLRRLRGTLGADVIDVGGFDLRGDLAITAKNGGVASVHDMQVDGDGSVAFGGGVSEGGIFASLRLGSTISLVNCAFGGDPAANPLPTGDLVLTTGSSADQFVLVGVTVGRDLKVTANAGVDTFTATNVSVGGALSANTAAGADQVILTDVEVAGPTNIDTGAGSDTVTIFSLGEVSTLHGNVLFNLGAGANVLGVVGFVPDGSDPPEALGVVFEGNLTANASGVSTVVALGAVDIGGDLAMTTGSGVDVFGATHMNVAGDVAINTGSGVDVVVIGAVPGYTGDNHIGGQTTINTGNSADVVVLQRTTFDGPLNINLGAGNDVLVLLENTYVAPVTASGGSGRNTAVYDDTFDPGPPNSLQVFGVQTDPNTFTAALVDFLLARAENWLSLVLGETGTRASSRARQSVGGTVVTSMLSG